MAPAMPSLKERIDAIEEAYEFLLAYAAQGTVDEPAGETLGVRHFLERIEDALDGLILVATDEISRHAPSLAGTMLAFVAVLEKDVEKTLAAVRLVRACPRIGSQLVDNLNASIHLRALLTDLFLLDEVAGK